MCIEKLLSSGFLLRDFFVNIKKIPDNYVIRIIFAMLINIVKKIDQACVQHKKKMETSNIPSISIEGRPHQTFFGHKKCSFFFAGAFRNVGR
jgi:hypothetical protein